MILEIASSSRPHAENAQRVRLGLLAAVAFCGVLPAVVLVLVVTGAIADGSAAIDFRPLYRAAEAIWAGESPYPPADALLTASGGPYVYPPLPAFLAMPFTVLPLDVAEVVVMTLQVAALFAVLYALRVRDWRCYGIVLLWPPVISAIQTGNVTLWLALAAALTWRWRERILAPGTALGMALAVKFLLWPLVLWLAATTRRATAVVAAAVGALLVLAPWAALGFDGLRGYPELLRRLEETVGDDAYTISNLVQQLGGPELLARSTMLAAGVSLVVWCVSLARRGDQRSSFIVALAAALVLSPLVWLHYFSLLIVVVSLGRPRLGLMWFVPLAMYVATGSEDPSLAEMLVTLTAAAVTVGLALREAGRGRVTVPERDVPVLGPTAA